MNKYIVKMMRLCNTSKERQMCIYILSIELKLPHLVFYTLNNHWAYSTIKNSGAGHY
jgi:hypothetical protein